MSGEREQLYKAIFEASPDGVVVVDERGVIREVNVAAENLFGYERGGSRWRSWCPGTSGSPRPPAAGVHRRPPPASHGDRPGVAGAPQGWRGGAGGDQPQSAPPWRGSSS